ncbi:caspase family protein [Haliangium sp. UPWRP_2]|uniref:caspase family protein n=1 Tax=Haliangium sp. UPWRP_2 TaxID=1931276 RepID=UPI0011B23702|nr:caspase family protein [Haliangium sp. UPWRP_2]
MPAAPPTDNDPSVTPPAQPVEAADADGTRNIGKPKPKIEASARRIQRRRALLIGVCEYQSSETFSPLRYPTKDVAAMRDLLIGYGYSQVTWLDDTVQAAHLRPTRANILRAVQELCDEAQPDDLIWIHFSGHGLRWARPSGGEAPLLAVQDTQAPDPLSTGIDIENELKPMLRACRARQKVMTLDACHLGYASTRAAGDAADQLAWDVGEGLAVLTASSSKQYAHESNTVGMGVFTNFLVGTLREKVNAQQLAALAETAKAVLSQVTEWYKKYGRLPQEPSVSFEGIGEILLVDQRPIIDRDRDRDPGPPPPDDNDLRLQVPNLQLTEELPRRPTCATNFLALQYVEGSTERPIVVATLLSREFTSAPRYRELRHVFALQLAKFEKLKHEGFARFLARGVVTDAKRTFFVTEFLQGNQLSEVLATLQLSYPALLERLANLASAMSAAHEAGLVHGLLSQDKVVSTPTGWKIVDLALSPIDVQLRLSERQNEPRPAYFAPELTAANPAPTTASDVYALGCLMDQCLDLPNPETGGTLRQASDPALRRLIAKMRSAQPGQRPPLGQVALKLRGLLPDSTQQRVIRRRKGQMLGLVGAAAAATTLIYGISKYGPQRVESHDLGPRLDLAKPESHRRPTDQTMVQQARELLSAALADRSNANLPGAAARSLGWLRDPFFSGPLSATLLRAESFPDARRLAAWALGRSGGIGASSALRDVLKNPNTDLELWREALESLCLLSRPDAVLNFELGRALLTESANKERRMIALGLFAATDPKSQATVASLAKATLAAARDPEQAMAQADLLLALARAQNASARTAMARLLQRDGAPSNAQIRLALLWVSAGDPTGIPLLQQLVQTQEPQGELTQLVTEARRLLARHSPKAAQCQQAEEMLRHPPAEDAADSTREVFFASLGVLPLCPRPATFIDALWALVSPGDPHVAVDPLLRIHAAANLIEILRPRHTVPPNTRASSESALSTRAIVARHIESSGLVALHMVHLQTAADPEAQPAARRQAARQARAERLVMEERRSQDPVVAEHLSKADVKTRENQLVEMQKSGRPVDKVVAVLAQHDDALVQSWQAQASSQPAEVQLALAERMQTPQTSDVLRRTLAAGNLDSLRAFGELRRRGEQLEVPRRDLLSEYSHGRAEDRLELIEAMSGWPFSSARPLLLLATNDGSVDVRRSAVRILGEAAADPQTEADALSILRLMFGDSDYIVHLYLRAVLEGKQLSASEVNDAPAWPPEQGTAAGCTVTLSGDDPGVQVETLDGAGSWQVHRLPLALNLPPGTAPLRYLDERGARRQRTLTCVGSERVDLPLPISTLGQQLGRGVQQWEAHKVDQAYVTFNQVHARAPGYHSKATDAPRRAEDVLVRSEYYLGKALQAMEKLPEARNHFAAYLARAAAVRQNDLTPDAKAQLDRLQSQLGRFVVRLQVDGKCQTFTAWDTPGRVDVNVDLGKGRKRTFKSQTLAARRETRGTDECKE